MAPPTDRPLHQLQPNSMFGDDATSPAVIPKRAVGRAVGRKLWASASAVKGIRNCAVILTCCREPQYRTPSLLRGLPKPRDRETRGEAEATMESWREEGATIGEADEGAVDEMVPIPSWKVRLPTARKIVEIRFFAGGRRPLFHRPPAPPPLRDDNLKLSDPTSSWLLSQRVVERAVGGKSHRRNPLLSTNHRRRRSSRVASAS
jgi:hypothetical protein